MPVNDNSASRVKARIVRQSIEAATVLRTLARECSSPDVGLSDLAYYLKEGAERIVVNAMMVEGIRIAVFSADEKEGGSQ